MNNPLIDTRDVRFVLYEILNIDSLTLFEKYSGFDHDTFEATLDLIESIAVKECHPHFADADKTGCSFNGADGSVTLPDSIKKPLKAYYDAGFIGMVESPLIGGMGLPSSDCRSSFRDSGLTRYASSCALHRDGIIASKMSMAGLQIF